MATVPPPAPVSAATVLLPPAPPRPTAIPAATLRPPFEPLITRAPSLNWAGPGDHWSRAWGVPEPVVARPAPLALPSAAVPARTPESQAADDPTPADLELVRASLGVLEPVAERATAHFYALLFLNHPELRSLFPAAMDVQRDRLFRALLAAARTAADPAALARQLHPVGRSHRRYGVVAEHYGPFGECLLSALARYCGNRWDARTETAWRRVYGLISRTMREGEADGATGPSWWQAEIVAHERRTREIAVVTLRPDQHYPYRAGQYTPLETPWWPRVWRNYSIACAPRTDGLLTFHVKAVPAGWVSNALVHRARPGDVLRLGPPEGGMVVDHTSGGSLLCLGGGTGIAPIRALVEEVAERGAGDRRVQVFYGARRNEELYELHPMLRLSQQHPWLSVHPVISDQRTLGLSGTLPEVVEAHGPWDEHDAYLSGPAAMVRRGVDALLRAGVAGERIRHDLGAATTA
ncbi:globin domain-containing protein [Streptacidiphilus griseoplanus]|uniref:globin domain-containing protein n=1 Tax=Peterkaempfera griseoplana TaxID=66896 RepID=UPI001FE149F9|nr:globin domain-containing protein [Peterkaempfera griseoplana]